MNEENKFLIRNKKNMVLIVVFAFLMKSLILFWFINESRPSKNRHFTVVCHYIFLLPETAIFQFLQRGSPPLPLALRDEFESNLVAIFRGKICLIHNPLFFNDFQFQVLRRFYNFRSFYRNSNSYVSHLKFLYSIFTTHFTFILFSKYCNLFYDFYFIEIKFYLFYFFLFFRNFSRHVSHTYGNCYTFNSNELIPSPPVMRRSGTQHG